MTARFTRDGVSYEIPWLTWNVESGNYVIDPLTAPGFGSWIIGSVDAPIYTRVCEDFDVDPLAEARQREGVAAVTATLRTLRRQMLLAAVMGPLIPSPQDVVMRASAGC